MKTFLLFSDTCKIVNSQLNFVLSSAMSTEVLLASIPKSSLESALVCLDNSVMLVSEETYSGVTECLKALLWDWRETGKSWVTDL
jgi:hypothetical protein